MTTWRYVISRNARRTATIVARIGSKMCAKHRLAEGTDGQARERDAELHRGDEAGGFAVIAQHGAGAPVALVARAR